VQGSKYLVRIDGVSGIVGMQNSGQTYYTGFPLFAEPLPPTIVSSSHVLSWKIHPPVVEMTARDCATQQIFLKAALKFGEDAFEVRFGVLPRVRDVGYEVSVVYSNWPWGLGVDISFPAIRFPFPAIGFTKGWEPTPIPMSKLHLKRR